MVSLLLVEQSKGLTGIPKACLGREPAAAGKPHKGIADDEIPSGSVLHALVPRPVPAAGRAELLPGPGALKRPLAVKIPTGRHVYLLPD
jgi:hypothetical protein